MKNFIINIPVFKKIIRITNVKIILKQMKYALMVFETNFFENLSIFVQKCDKVGSKIIFFLEKVLQYFFEGKTITIIYYFSF